MDSFHISLYQIYSTQTPQKTPIISTLVDTIAAQLTTLPLVGPLSNSLQVWNSGFSTFRNYKISPSLVEL